MGNLDWNSNGMADKDDDRFFHEVIRKNDDTSTNTTTPQHRNQKPNPGIGLGTLTKLVMIAVIVLCVLAIFMGYAHIIGDLLGLGVLACIFAHWLEN